MEAVMAWIKKGNLATISLALFFVACGGDRENSVEPNASTIGLSLSSDYRNGYSSSCSDEFNLDSSDDELSNFELKSTDSGEKIVVVDTESSSSEEQKRFIEESSDSEGLDGAVEEFSDSNRPESSAEESSSSKKSSSSRNDSEYDPENNMLTDYRDGNVYATTTIAIPSKNYSEVWMAENLRYKMKNSYCYEDSAKYCDAYGRLYTWAAAVGKPESVCGGGHECGLGTNKVQGACPKGWHLPTEAEWIALIIAVDGTITEYIITENGSKNTAGKKLKSKNVWGWGITDISGDGMDFFSGDGMDSFGFSAFPAGCRDSYGDYIHYSDVGCGYFGISTCFWSSHEVLYRDDLADYMYLDLDDERAYLNHQYESYGCSVRCIKD